MEQRIEIDRLEQAVNIFGSFDENIRLIEEEFQVLVTNREGELRINGEPEDVMLAAKAIHALLTLSSRGETIGEQTVRYVIGLAREGPGGQVSGANPGGGGDPPPPPAGLGAGGRGEKNPATGWRDF